jgi:hypothetical protein
VNVTVAAEGRAAFTPLFTGSNPARVPSGPRAGERLQGDEVELALALVSSLDARQLGAAMLRGRSFGDILAGPGRPDALATPEGLPATALTEAQRATLLRLIETYVGLARDEFGRPYLELVRAGLARRGSRGPADAARHGVLLAGSTARACLSSSTTRRAAATTSSSCATRQRLRSRRPRARTTRRFRPGHGAVDPAKGVVPVAPPVPVGRAGGARASPCKSGRRAGAGVRGERPAPHGRGAGRARDYFWAGAAWAASCGFTENGFHRGRRP